MSPSESVQTVAVKFLQAVALQVHRVSHTLLQ